MKKYLLFFAAIVIITGSAMFLENLSGFTSRLQDSSLSFMSSLSASFIIVEESPSAQIIGGPEREEKLVQKVGASRPLVNGEALTAPNRSETPLTVLPENTVSAVASGDESPGLLEIKEQIAELIMPPRIIERIYQPDIPSFFDETEQLAESDGNQPPVAGTGGGTDEEIALPVFNSTSTLDVSTSTPEVSTSTSALPEFDFFLSGYSVTARQFSVNWQSSSTDVSFEIRQSIDNENWAPFLLATSSGGELFLPVKDETIYFFGARVANSLGSTSDWRLIEAPINFYPVVFNEIAWAGTGTSSKARNDEWIELFNKTALTVDLSGWSLARTSGTTTSEIVVLNNSVGPGAFYLIERSDDTAVAGVTADLAKSFSGGGLDNSGEDIFLIDNFGQIIDQLNYLAGWPSGSAGPDYLTMERVSPFVAGDVLANWRSNEAISRNGISVDGLVINGTPKAPNSVIDFPLFNLSVASTTATSTLLNWTALPLNDIKECKINRWQGATSSAPDLIGSVAPSSLEFFDNALLPRTEYYYQISARDEQNNYLSSNIVVVATPTEPEDPLPEIDTDIGDNAKVGDE